MQHDDCLAVDSPDDLDAEGQDFVEALDEEEARLFARARDDEVAATLTHLLDNGPLSQLRPQTAGPLANSRSREVQTVHAVAAPSVVEELMRCKEQLAAAAL